MKFHLTYIIAIICVASIVYCIKSCRAIDALNNEIATYQRNERAFIDGIEHYKTCNDLSCAKVDELELSLADAKKVIGDDMKTIESLKLKIKNMEQAGKIAVKSEFKVVERLKDTTIVKERETIFRDTIHDVKYVDVVRPYYDVHATIVHDTIDLDVVTRDSLLVIECVEYKRFLGFLWKTKRVKRRTIDVVSKNPNTIIEDVQIVTIKK